MNALDPAAPTFAALLGALLGAAAAGSLAADASPAPTPTTESQSRATVEGGETAAMMKDCIEREQKKPGIDHATAEVSCRGQGEAARAAQAQPAKPEGGADAGTSASGHSSHSGVTSSQQRATDPVPLAPTAEGKSTRPKTAK